jgi:dTDP-4-dehydrorhamnose reductase
VYATYHSDVFDDDYFFPLDISDAAYTMAFIDEMKPDVVVLTAAYTNVDGCEKNKEDAFSLNVTGTKNVAEACETVGAKMVYISSDYVFNGMKGHYSETDGTDPIDYYGLTKLMGEEQVKSICSNFIIARTSVLYGIHKPNFVTWLISQLEKKKSFEIVTDQIISPTYTFDLSEQLLALLDRDACGMFHTAGGEILSRFDMAVRIAEVFDYDVDLVKPTSMEMLSWVAKRPKDSSLNVSKIAKFKKPYSLEESLGLLRSDFGGVE